MWFLFLKTFINSLFFQMHNMSISQARSKRKPTGSNYKDFRSKKHHECGNSPVRTRIGEIRTKVRRIRSGKEKLVLLRTENINLFDPKTKKSVKAKMVSVVDNPANRNFIRANILTRGTVVKTDKGDARITNRPGQEGTVNGILV